MSRPNALSIINAEFPNQSAKKIAKVQSLWSNYGEISRYIIDETHPIILKWVELPVLDNLRDHPRGWSGQTSNARKISSYINEQRFYKDFARNCSEHCYCPKHITSHCFPSESDPALIWLLMEDLDAAGFDKRYTLAPIEKVKECIDWLAYFHASFIDVSTENLWKTGTYWHLQTRLDEFDAMPDDTLKQHAFAIDQKLNDAKYKTLLHGDAKLANFCFDVKNHRVAAVDFQYTGRGIGVRDLCYLIGSCYYGNELALRESELKEYYFTQFERAMTTLNKGHVTKSIVDEWLHLYPFCWADFERFLRGWAPNHNKLSGFSKEMTDLAIGAC